MTLALGEKHVYSFLYFKLKCIQVDENFNLKNKTQFVEGNEILLFLMWGRTVSA